MGMSAEPEKNVEQTRYTPHFQLLLFDFLFGRLNCERFLHEKATNLKKFGFVDAGKENQMNAKFS